MPSVPEKYRVILTAEKLGEAVGVSRWTICAIRKAGRELNDLLPRYASVDDVRRWLRRHPEFVASHWLKKPKQPCTQPGQEPSTAGKFCESSRPRDLHTPSPVVSEPQLVPAG